MSDTLTRWAMIQSRLKEARAKVLEAEGITESALRELEQSAAVHLEMGDVIETEYGKVQKIFDKPVQFTARRLTATIDFKHKLKLLKQGDK